MTAMEHRPQPMSRAELADLLMELSGRVRSGDSTEGHLEYLLPTDEDEVPANRGESSADTVMVQAGYRVGNLGGQGGFMMIGLMVDAPTGEPTVEVPRADLTRMHLRLRDALRSERDVEAWKVTTELAHLAGLPGYESKADPS